MIFPLCKWYFDINWQIWKKVGRRFSNLPKSIHLNPLQFCPSMPLLGFPVFCLSSSIALNRYFHNLVNSLTIWSVLKLPKIAWPSHFKVIDHLQDPVTWYGINYTGTQMTQWDFQNKGKSGWTGKSSFVLKVPLRHLRPSVIYSVPCDWILQMAYSLVLHCASLLRTIFASSARAHWHVLTSTVTPDFFSGIC